MLLLRSLRWLIATICLLFSLAPSGAFAGGLSAAYELEAAYNVYRAAVEAFGANQQKILAAAASTSLGSDYKHPSGGVNLKGFIHIVQGQDMTLPASFDVNDADPHTAANALYQNRNKIKTRNSYNFHTVISGTTGYIGYIEQLMVVLSDAQKTAPGGALNTLLDRTNKCIDNIMSLRESDQADAMKRDITSKFPKAVYQSTNSQLTGYTQSWTVTKIDMDGCVQQSPANTFATDGTDRKKLKDWVIKFGRDTSYTQQARQHYAPIMGWRKARTTSRTMCKSAGIPT